MSNYRKDKLLFNIKLKLYPFTIIVSMGDIEEHKLLNKIVQLGVTKEESKSAIMSSTEQGRTVLFGESTVIMVRVRNLPITPNDYGTLHHEIFHAVTYLLWRIGMKLSIKKSDEAYAYLYGHLTERVYKHLQKNIKD